MMCNESGKYWKYYDTEGYFILFIYVFANLNICGYHTKKIRLIIINSKNMYEDPALVIIILSLVIESHRNN